MLARAERHLCMNELRSHFRGLLYAWASGERTLDQCQRAQFCIQHQDFYTKSNQAGKQAKQASKLRVSKIASQQAERAQPACLLITNSGWQY